MKIYTEKINGSDVIKVIMENSRGMLVELMSYGAAIRRVAVKNGDKYDTLTQSFTDYDEYIIRNTAYNGKTLAPNAGRFYVSEGINIDAENTIHPEANERGINSLHGSSKSVSTDNWKLELADVVDEKATAVFTTSQPDGLCGWPGNRDYRVEYTLDEDNTLSIELKAKTDKTTYINMSNHAYWNLNLDSDKALEQIVCINAESVVFNDKESIPYKIVNVADIKESDGIDFTIENTLKDIIPMTSETEYSAQMRLGKGLNNAFIFGKHTLADCLCSISDSKKKRTLKMYSDAPAMVAYSGGSMDEGLELENGQISKRSCSIAFEFQEMPTIQKPTVTVPGREFKRTIIFKVEEKLL